MEAIGVPVKKEMDVINILLFLIRRVPASVERVEQSRCRKEHDKKKDRRHEED
jgi:hypothetical protein